MSSKPIGYGNLKSHFVLDDTVYFATTPTTGCDTGDESVLSCNLTRGRGRGQWKCLSTSPKWAAFQDLHPAFDSPGVQIGGMLFWEI